jgi:cytidylate kinase
LLEKISEETDLRTELIESVDEKRTNWLVECLESLSGKTTVTGRYIGNLSNVLRSLGAHGHCVIVGRGASIVLRPETTLRVRVVAPLAERVRNTRNQLSLTEHEAMRYVEKIDSERASFVKEHFHVDPNDVHRFDLVLNTSRFSDGACADLVVDALGKLGDRNRKTAPTRGSCI